MGMLIAVGLVSLAVGILFGGGSVLWLTREQVMKLMDELIELRKEYVDHLLRESHGKKAI